MGHIVKISAKDKPSRVRKALEELNLKMAVKKLGKKKPKTFADFYGSLPGVYGDGLTYQKKVRDEWE